MKKIIALLVLAILPQTQAFELINGKNALNEIKGINYDYDWTGINFVTHSPCRLMVDADYEYEIHVSLQSRRRNRTLAQKTFSMNEEMLFSKVINENIITYTEFTKINNPFQAAKVIEVTYDEANFKATVNLKNGAKDLGLSCTVAYDP